MPPFLPRPSTLVDDALRPLRWAARALRTPVLALRRRVRTRRWLDAERAGRDELAEERLESVFEALPRPRPSAGFAERVLVAAGIVAAPRPYGAVERVVVALALTVVGAVLATSGPFALALVWDVATALPGLAVDAGVALVTTTAALVDELTALVRFVHRLWAAAALVGSASPWFHLGLTALTSLALAALWRLTTSTSTAAGRTCHV